MDNPAIPNITSFVIRFVQTEPGSSACRGSVTHVQTNQEYLFTHWSDAVGFMQRFVPLTMQPDEDRDPTNPENEP